jgi:hypothetical protein
MITFWATIAALGLLAGFAAAHRAGQRRNVARLAQLDGFTPSMARWGYVGARRGGR